MHENLPYMASKPLHTRIELAEIDFVCFNYKRYSIYNYRGKVSELYKLFLRTC